MTAILPRGANVSMASGRTLTKLENSYVVEPQALADIVKLLCRFHLVSSVTRARPALEQWACRAVGLFARAAIRLGTGPKRFWRLPTMPGCEAGLDSGTDSASSTMSSAFRASSPTSGVSADRAATTCRARLGPGVSVRETRCNRTPHPLARRRRSSFRISPDANRFYPRLSEGDSVGPLVACRATAGSNFWLRLADAGFHRGVRQWACLLSRPRQRHVNKGV